MALAAAICILRYSSGKAKAKSPLPATTVVAEQHVVEAATSTQDGDDYGD